MFTVYGMRSLYTSVRFLRACQCLTRKFPSWTLDNNFYSTSWPSLRIITKSTRKINSLCFTNPVLSYSTKSSKSSPPFRYVRHLNKKLALLKTVEEHLELFESVGESASIGDRAAILFNIAKITERDEEQKQVLEQEREKSQQGQSSTYMELLERIANDISQGNSWNLANLMWALGKIQEKDHKLVHVCEQEILSRGTVAFNNAEICQIMNGCSNLNLTTSDIFQEIQDAIVNEEVKIYDFEDRELSGILCSFAKTDNGSFELFCIVLEEILSRDPLKIGSRALAEFVWSFAKLEFKADKLFDRVEEEILRRGTNDLNNAAFSKILWAFGMVKRGSKRFFYFLDSELASRGVERFDNALLLEIVWCFTRRNVTKANVFDLVKLEVFNRGVHKFQNHELVLILFSFVSAQRHDDELVAAIEGELCLRDAAQLSKGDLCQVAWSLGRAGKTDSHLFDAIEGQVLQRCVHDLPSKENHMLMLMRGFIEAKRGTEALYEFLARFFSATDFGNLRESGICECAWCFAKASVEAGEVFDAIEREIFNRSKYLFSEHQIAFMKEIFRKVGKGSKEFYDL